MKQLTFSKNDFDINKINSMFDDFCKDNRISGDDTLNIELISEEFLSNILFPNYENQVVCTVSKEEEGVLVSFEYEGDNYLNKINDETILSLKILKSKTRGIITDNENGKTSIKFVI